MNSIQGQYFTELTSIRTVEAIHELLLTWVKEIGLVYFWYMQTQSSLRSSDPFDNINNYPKEFAQEYIKEQLSKVDPVVLNAFKTLHPAFWDEIFIEKDLNEKALQELAWAKQYEINSGIVCPIFIFNQPAALLHVVIPSTFSLLPEDVLTVKTHLQTMTCLLFQKINLLSTRIDSTSITLSPREIDCLLWAAKGKSSWEIAKILKLSEHTVREYVANAKHKLNANTLTEAVMKAFLQRNFSFSDFYSYFNY